jgi:hypothetical protein
MVERSIIRRGDIRSKRDLTSDIALAKMAVEGILRDCGKPSAYFPTPVACYPAARLDVNILEQVVSQVDIMCQADQQPP